MKRINIQLLALFLILALNAAMLKNTEAQTYQPVLKTDSTSWTIAHQELFGIVVEYFHANTIQDSTFSQVFSNDLWNPYIGKLRENAADGKVWFTSAINNVEYLIMDMSLEIGDIFAFRPGLLGQVDSVYYVDDKKVIQFDLYSSRWDEPIQFIEGVAPNNAFSVDSDFDWYYVSCKYDQTELSYVNRNAHFIGCMPDPTGLKENSGLRNEITIYPNPCSGMLDINILNFNTTKLSIIDLYGRVLKQFYIENTSNRINLNELTNGIYLLKAEVGNSVFTKTFVIKQ